MTEETIINYLTIHKKEFQEKFNVEQIGLFGSYARGEEIEESDIDIDYVRVKGWYAVFWNFIP